MPNFHFYSFFIITISTISPLCLTLPSLSPNSETLHPRREVSANIWCSPNALTPSDRWSLNILAPGKTYDSLEQLCRFDRSRPNVGCLCDSPYVQVECRRELRDPLLYAAFFPKCALNCYCLHSSINPFDTSIAVTGEGERERRPIVPFTGGQRSDPEQAAQAAQRATGHLSRSHSERDGRVLVRGSGGG